LRGASGITRTHFQQHQRVNADILAAPHKYRCGVLLWTVLPGDGGSGSGRRTRRIYTVGPLPILHLAEMTAPCCVPAALLAARADGYVAVLPSHRSKRWRMDRSLRWHHSTAQTTARFGLTGEKNVAQMATRVSAAIRTVALPSGWTTPDPVYHAYGTPAPHQHIGRLARGLLKFPHAASTFLHGASCCLSFGLILYVTTTGVRFITAELPRIWDRFGYGPWHQPFVCRHLSPQAVARRANPCSLSLRSPAYINTCFTALSAAFCRP